MFQIFKTPSHLDKIMLARVIKRYMDGCKIKAPSQRRKPHQSKKARWADTWLHLPVPLCPCIKKFREDMQKRTQAIYHSLCTNMPKYAQKYTF